MLAHGPRQAGSQVSPTLDRQIGTVKARGFKHAWAAACRDRNGRAVAAELTPLAKRLYVEALRRPVDREVLKKSIEDMLEFLSSDAGKTHANVYAVSLFLDVDDDWEGHWQDVPEDLYRILARMSAEMYRAVEDPSWTANFGAIPEQLLAKLRGTAV